MIKVYWAFEKYLGVWRSYACTTVTQYYSYTSRYRLLLTLYGYRKYVYYFKISINAALIPVYKNVKHVSWFLDPQLKQGQQ